MNAIEVIAQVLSKTNFKGTLCTAKCTYENYSKKSFIFFEEENDYSYGESMDIPCLRITTTTDKVILPINSVDFEHVLEISDMLKVGFTKEDIANITQVMADILRKTYHLVNGNRLIETFVPCSDKEVVSKYLFALKQTASLL